MYAIVETGGKQYRVQEGDVIFVERIDAEEGGTVDLSKVLLVAKDGEVKAIAVFHEIHCLVWFRTTSVHDPLLIESNSTVFEQLSTRMHTSSPNSNISNLKQDRFLTPALPIASPNHPPNITSDTAMIIRPLQCSSRTRS